MIDYKYYEYDGNDPGLDVSAYDGTEYQIDGFGERIGSDDIYDDAPDDSEVEDETANTNIEDGFRETIKPDNGDKEDQIHERNLQEAAESVYGSDPGST